MGSASSKPTRTLRSTVTSQLGNTGKSKQPAQSQAPVLEHNTSRFSKDASIIHDAKDPQYLQNLGTLGQVKVQGIREEFSHADSMLGIMEVRARNDALEEENSAHSGALSAAELVGLLEEYKAAPSPALLDRLAVEYDTDRNALERLVKWVAAAPRQPTAS
ncbi:hypothetical protein MVES1_003542 [Malassezia vespertilionis]|uniref:uncharacterized protein n=1 Tax=Malassezia vespertilionis TaxID=2020962 RepID=UPI0024B0EAB7|nr:uncharacterized protein MVES1_003542 [Malassezia vespertilionis]WFD08171.1 hypothetical protein MVES1_003542 [Malassezia vespertilionis]